jgi:hypothetical protein
LSDVVIGSDDSTGKVTANRWVLATLTVTAGVVVGLAPVLIATNGAYLLPYFSGGMIVVAAFYFAFIKLSGRKFHTTATNPLTFLELLLAGLSTVSAWALSGFIWFIFYQLFKLIGWLSVRVGLFGAFNYDAIAFWGTLFFAILFGTGVFVSSLYGMISKLYPNTAGVRSAFYDLATRRRRWLVYYLLLGVAFPALVGLTAYLTTARPPGTWFYIFLQLYLFIVTSGLSTGPQPGQLNKDSAAPAVEAVVKLLNSLGYKIMPQPKIGDQELDPFLVNLDLLAYNDQRAIAIEIKTQKESPAPVEWTVASSLRMAALTIKPELEKLGINTETIDLFLVLNDRKPAASLIDFSNNLKETPEQGMIHIVEIPSTTIAEILATDDQMILKNIARDVGLSVDDMNAAAPSISPFQAAEGGERS